MTQQPYGSPPDPGYQQESYGQQQSYGRAQSYGQQESYGRAQYPGYGPPRLRYLDEDEPAGRRNGFAVAGAWLSILPLFGLIFSIAGLVRSGQRGGAGRTLSIVGIVLSLAFAGIIVVVSGSLSTVTDPGCVAAGASANQAASKMNADSNAMDQAAGSQAAERAAAAKFSSDIQQFTMQLDTASAEATHASVKSAINAMNSDMAGMNSALESVENGDSSQAGSMDDYANRLGPDASAIGQACGPYGGMPASS